MHCIPSSSLAQSVSAVDRFAAGLITRKVNQLVGRHGFAEQDREQLRQELIAKLVQSRQRFDSEKQHPNVFTTTVVERAVASIVRQRKAKKRGPRRVRSLSETIVTPTGERVPLADAVGHAAYDARRGIKSREEVDAFELRVDVAAVMAKLPPELRTLAEQLKRVSVSELAAQLGIPRSTLRDRIKSLRAAFEESDLRFSF